MTSKIIITPAALPDCYELQFPVFRDTRGSFVKTLQASVLRSAGLNADFVESFYTVSAEGVLRGMHVQLPPSAHAKLVYCIGGSILDVALDLRAGSPTYGKHAVFRLQAELGNAVYLPEGVAHGFFVERGPAQMMYHVTSEHDPARDSGVRWDSFGARWPSHAPMISARDAALPAFEAFESPFRV